VADGVAGVVMIEKVVVFVVVLVGFRVLVRVLLGRGDG
jgi:hypothetical protein